MNKQAIEGLPDARSVKSTSEATHEMKLPSVHSTPSDIPTVSANIADHEVSQGFRSSTSWPDGERHSELLVHFHLCELLHAWNLSPYRRTESQGVATVDEYAEHLGITRFAFLSEEGRSDFLEVYGLDDFVVMLNNFQDVDPYFYLTLTNKFHPDDVRAFLDVYKSAMNTLAVIHDERERAIHNDGNKVGFITADHFATREVAELTKVRAAREKLGAPSE